MDSLLSAYFQVGESDKRFMSKKKLITLLFNRLGPYHHARLRAAGMRGKVVALELSSKDETYAWDIVEGAEQFERMTLFHDTDETKQSVIEINKRVAAALEKIKPEAVAICGWSGSINLSALHWCITHKTPVILMSDSTAYDEPRKHWKEFIKSRIVRMCSSALVGGTPHVDYVATLGMPRQHIFKCYDVIDNTYFATEAKLARQKSDDLRKQLSLPKEYFLASSRFIKKKNIPYILETYALYHQRVGKSAWKLVLLGDGTLKSQLVKMIREFGLEKYVLLPGFKQYNELPIYYALAKAFVHASTTEQWGLVVNEAMASGLPVIVSERCGCAPDLVKNGYNGFTFNPYEIDTLVELMSKFTLEYDLDAMGQASYETIEDWSPDRFAKNLWKAAEIALNKPCPQANWLDKILLWALKYHR